MPSVVLDDVVEDKVVEAKVVEAQVERPPPMGRCARCGRQVPLRDLVRREMRVGRSSAWGRYSNQFGWADVCSWCLPEVDGEVSADYAKRVLWIIVGCVAVALVLIGAIVGGR